MSDEETAEIKTGYDADIQALRDEMSAMREEFSKTIDEYRQANSDLWARLQSQQPVPEPSPEIPEKTSEEVFNSIMR